MDNKVLLTVIAVVLIGIFAVSVIQMNQEPDTIGEQIDETIEEVELEILMRYVPLL